MYRITDLSGEFSGFVRLSSGCYGIEQPEFYESNPQRAEENVAGFPKRAQEEHHRASPSRNLFW
jgi:hypothetical protein